MTTPDEAAQQLRRIRGGLIQSRWGQLYELSKDSGDSAIRYLFTTNAGGAVGVLAYLGSVADKGGSPLSAKMALIFFFTGLLFVGFYRIYMVHHHESLFEHYKGLVCEYHEGDIDWKALLESDDKRVGSSIVPYVLGYFSFFGFVLGCIAGAIGIL